MRSYWWPTRPPSSSSSRSGAGFDADLSHEAVGYREIIVSGAESGVARLKREAGGHRWQRIPPTERRGRVHTSTVTVAVLELSSGSGVVLREQDLVWETMRGSGAGGQHRNTTDSAVRVRHLPTGVEAYCCSNRSQHQNRAAAREVLVARISKIMNDNESCRSRATRKGQIGSGQRGDKIRTYRVRDGVVIDHLTNRKLRLADVLAGKHMPL